MSSADNDAIGSVWGRAMRSKLVQMALLCLALAPTIIVAVVALRIWLAPNDVAIGWQSRIWPVVFLQLIAIIVYWGHASRNKSLIADERNDWGFQFIVFIPFGMLSYWKRYVWRS